MPKQVDHEARRQQITEAVCRLAARQGLEAVTLRHVAAEAGVSMGLVQHYFTTKDEMLLFAFHATSARVEQRIATAVAALPDPPDTRALLRTLLVAMLAIDDDSRAEAPLWVAFLARAVVEPSLASPLSESGKALADFVGAQLRQAHQAGALPADVDPEREASSLLALVDGLMVHALIDQDSAEEALLTLDYHLGRIFIGPPPT